MENKGTNNVVQVLFLIIVAVGAAYLFYYKDAMVEIDTLNVEIEDMQKKVDNLVKNKNYIVSYTGSQEEKNNQYLYQWYYELFPSTVLPEDIVENIQEIAKKEEPGYIPIKISDISFSEVVAGDVDSTVDQYNGLANYQQISTTFDTTYGSLLVFLDNIRKNMPKLVVSNLSLTPSAEASVGDPILTVVLNINALSSTSTNKMAGSKYEPKGLSGKNNIFTGFNPNDKTEYILQLNNEIQKSNLKKINYSKSDFYIALNTQEPDEDGEILPAVILGKTSNASKSLFGDEEEHNIKISINREDNGNYTFSYTMDDKVYPVQVDKEKFVPIKNNKFVIEILCNELRKDEKTKVNIEIENNVKDMNVEYSITGDSSKRVSVKAIKGKAIEVNSSIGVTTQVTTDVESTDVESTDVE